MHVIDYNTTAQNFYSNNGYLKLKLCEEFYTINNTNYDAYLYILYIPPHTYPLWYHPNSNNSGVITVWVNYMYNIFTTITHYITNSDTHSTTTNTTMSPSETSIV